MKALQQTIAAIIAALVLIFVISIIAVAAIVFFVLALVFLIGAALFNSLAAVTGSNKVFVRWTELLAK